MPDSQTAVLVRRGARLAVLPPRPSAGAPPPSLIDTALVRAELARLRAPRPQTQLHRANRVYTTVPARV